MGQAMVPYTQRGIKFAVLRGPVHQARALARKLERQGQIKVLGQGVTYRDGGRVLAAIPYVPRRSGLAEWYRRRYTVWAGAVVMGLGALAAVAALLWQLRFAIMGGAGLTLAAFCLWRLFGHGAGCAGLHCSGCRG